MYKNSARRWKQSQDIKEAYSSWSPEAIALVKKNNAMSVEEVKASAKQLAKKKREAELL